MFHGAGSQQPISQTVTLPIKEGNAIVVSIKTSPKLGAASFKFVNTDDATAFCLWAKTLDIPFNFDKRMTEALLDPANNVAAEALEAKDSARKEFSVFFEAPYYQQILQGINNKLDAPEVKTKEQLTSAKHHRIPSNGHTTTLFKSLAITTDEIKASQKAEPSKTTKETITHSPKALRPVAPQPGLHGKLPDELVLDPALAPLSRLTASQNRATIAHSLDSEIKPTGYENLTNRELLEKQTALSENLTERMKEVSRRLATDPANPALNQLWQNMTERSELLSRHREATGFKLFSQISQNAPKKHSVTPSRNNSPAA